MCGAVFGAVCGTGLRTGLTGVAVGCGGITSWALIVRLCVACGAVRVGCRTVHKGCRCGGCI
jgi:hypothetical protein